MDRAYFKYICIKHGVSFDDVSKIIGCNLATLYRKLSGESDFTRNEIQIIRGALDLSTEDVDKIFFAA